MSEIVFIEVDTVGETTGQKYKARVEIKLFLTAKEKVVAAEAVAREVGAINTSSQLYAVIESTLIINAHLVEKPQWWGKNGMELKDSAPVFELAVKIQEDQKRFADAQKE